MLKIAHRLQELDFAALMEVYEEGNRENGEDCFPDLPVGQQILRAEQAFYQYLEECFFREAEASYYIWLEDGRYVSALRLECYQDGLLLEALETHPKYRGRGYAKKLVQAAMETVGEQKVYVHISKRNRPSIAVHTHCGFRKILDHAVYADGSVLSSANTYRYEKSTL